MRTSNSTPVGIALILAVSVTVVCGAIAYSLLGYLQGMSVTTQSSWWVPVLTFGAPVAVIGSILIWLYSQQ